MAKKRIKLISWNVNGLRAVMKKGFPETFKTLDADVLALQETKLQEHQRTDDMIQGGGMLLLRIDIVKLFYPSVNAIINGFIETLYYRFACGALLTGDLDL